MARIFTAGNELSDPLNEGWYWPGINPYVSVNQRFGPRTSEQNSGEWYYYVPQNWELKHYPGYFGKPPSFPVPDIYNELFVKFHLYPSAYVSGERSVVTFLGGDDTDYYTLTIYDDGGGTTSGSAVGLRIRQGHFGTVITDNTNVIFNNVWTLVEVHCRLGAGGTGLLEIRLNEVVVASLAGTFLGPLAQTQMAGISMRNYQNGGTSAVNSFDNFALNDTTGSFNNTWPGDGFVYVRMPHRDGTTTQLATDLDAGGFDNADRLGGGDPERVPRLNRYGTTGNWGTGPKIHDPGFVRPTAVPQKDTYTILPLPFDAGQVNAVSIFSQAKSRDGLAGNVRHIFKPLAQAEILGAAHPIPSDELGAQATHLDINPNTSAPFTVTEIQGGELGIQFEA